MDDEDLDDVVPAVVLKMFAENFIEGFLNMMSRLGFSFEDFDVLESPPISVKTQASSETAKVSEDTVQQQQQQQQQKPEEKPKPTMTMKLPLMIPSLALSSVINEAANPSQDSSDQDDDDWSLYFFFHPSKIERDRERESEKFD